MPTTYSVCPYCGKKNDRAAPVGDESARGAVPKAGSVSICIGCAEVSVWENDFIGLRLRKPSVEEREVLDGDPRIVEVQRAMRTVKARRAPR